VKSWREEKIDNTIASLHQSIFLKLHYTTHIGEFKKRWAMILIKKK